MPDFTAKVGAEQSHVHQLRTALAAARAAHAESERERKVLDEFVSTLSHELRSPLNAMYGWAQVLLEMDPQDSDIRQGIEAIERNARLQLKLINDLLDVKRIVSGRIVLNKERIDLDTIVRSVVDSIRPVATEKQIDLLYNPAHPEVTVKADRARIEQVVFNLLSNALKFTPEHGSVIVSCGRRNEQATITVEDTGIGISADLLPHIFERFHQGAAELSKRHAGLGIGLAVVRRLVELHDGNVTVTSTPRGSKFTIALPSTLVPDGSAKCDCDRAPRTETNSLDSVRILLVDDEPDAVGFVTHMLERQGAVVSVARTGDEALAWLDDARFDVLISNIGLPAYSGLELMKRIRARSADDGGTIPAVALTAYARNRDIVASRDAGFHHHLAKPIQGDELVRIVETLARRE